MPPKQASGSLKRKRKAKQVALIKSQKWAMNKFLKKQDAGPSNIGALFFPVPGLILF